MLEGLYAAASGMEAQQQQVDAVANDIANVDTPGYRQTIVGFHDLLYSTGGYGSSVATGAGSAAQIVGRGQTQGAIEQTGQPLDVAINGDGYLEVRRADGTIGLTRNGALQLDGQGRLTNAQGMVLQPPITLPRGVAPDQVTIAANGSVSTGGRTLGKLSLVTVPNPDGLTADGDSLFSATAASGPLGAAKTATLQQGVLEASNVDVGTAMTEMVQAQQNYSMGSQAVQFQNQLLQIANQIKP